MKNWRTSLTGVLAALGQILPLFGIPGEVGTALSTVGLFFLGYLAKDNSVSGTGR